MARFEWTRYGGEEIEHALSVMLSRRFPHSRRIRPSRGDGGRDKAVPVGDRFEVYQFKKFAQNLTPGQKRQCENSYKRILALHNSGSISVCQWHLTMPLDPTPENETWFNTFTTDAPFACDWRGFDFCEGLVAEFPDVIDYYFHDGKQKLNSAINNLYGLLGIQRVAEQGGEAWLQPADVSGDLAKLYRALNQSDPHYRYAFIVDESDAIPPHDDMVFATQHRANDSEPYVTHMVFPRYDDAINDRPIPIRVQVDVRHNDELLAAIEAFHHYGTPVEFPMGTVKFEADLPGGLGGTFENGAARFGPSQIDERPPPLLRLQVVDENELELANVTVVNDIKTHGATKRGVRLVGKEQHGTFDIEMLIDFDDATFNLQLNPRPLSGTHPKAIEAGLHFLSMFRTPHFLRVMPEYGPAMTELLPIEYEGIEMETTINLAQALSQLQEHTFVRLTMPDENVDPEYMHTVIRYAALLRGEVVTEHWSSGFLTVSAEALDTLRSFEFGFAVERKEEFGMRVGHHDVKFGVQLINIASVVIDQNELTIADGNDFQVKTKPGISDIVTYRLADSTDDPLAS